MKQTAVEFLIEELKKYKIGELLLKIHKEEINQAKKIKKEKQEEEVNKLILLLRQAAEYELLQSSMDKVETFKNK